MSKLPKDIVDWVAENLVFISSSDEYWAFSLPKEEWTHKQGFVFLSESMKGISEKKQVFWIAHEIAHHKLQHKSPIFSNLTEKEITTQEEKADEIAMKWLS